MEQSKPKKSFIQFIKFALVGASNTLVDLIITRILGAIFGWYYVSKIIGYICGVANSYILNTGWTFKEERKRNIAEVTRFIAVNLVVLGISLALMYLFQSAFHLDTWWISTMGENWFTKIITGEYFCTLCSTVICIFINFMGNKLFVFRQKADKRTGESNAIEGK